MKVCWAGTASRETPEQVGIGCRMWARALNIPIIPLYDKIKGSNLDEHEDYDVILCVVTGGTLHHPKIIKEKYPNKKVIALFDYNSIETINIIKEGNFETLNYADYFISPKIWAGFLKVLFNKPVFEFYRPYSINDKHFEVVEREKKILITEHCKSKFVFPERIIAKKICDSVPGYDYVIKKVSVVCPDWFLLNKYADQKTLNYFKLEDKHGGTNAYRYKLSIDHYISVLFGGFPSANAFSGTPCVGITASQAQQEAFPECTFEPFQLDKMVDMGIKLLTDEDFWNKTSKYAKDYANKNWSLEACRKLFNDEMLPVLNKDLGVII